MKVLRKIVSALCIVVVVIALILCLVNIGAHFMAPAGWEWNTTLFGALDKPIVLASQASWGGFALWWGCVAVIAGLIGYMIAPAEMASHFASLRESVTSAAAGVVGTVAGAVAGATSGLLDAALDSGLIWWVVGGVGLWLLLRSSNSGTTRVEIAREAAT